MTYPVTATDPGVTRQVLAENPEMMVVAFRFQTGAKGALHSHKHLQSTYVAAGRFTFHLGEVDYEIGLGDSLIIPSGVVHGCTCHEAGLLVDTFAPRRDDFL
ncbi:MAG: cupin domain-containing protein [bacterium]